MQRWGGILFIPFFRTQSSAIVDAQYRFLRLVELLIEQVSPRTILFSNNSFFEQFVDWYIGFIILLQRVRIPTSVGWCTHLLFAVQRAWVWDYVDFEPSNKIFDLLNSDAFQTRKFTSGQINKLEIFRVSSMIQHWIKPWEKGEPPSFSMHPNSITPLSV